MSLSSERRVAIAWHGLPAYAARALRATSERLGPSLDIIGTKGFESPEYLESLVGRKIRWIGAGERIRWSDLGLVPPAVFFYTGWAYRAFNSLALEAKRRGSYTVCMVDNCRKGNLRQVVGKWYFRAAIRRNADQFLVPASSGQDLLRYFGVPAENIHQGLYGADCQLFFPGPPFGERANEFIFVGQFIARKGIRRMIEAVGRLRAAGRQFQFVAVGEGPLRQQLVDGGFAVCGFSRPEAIAARLRDSRFLVLPSVEDHWPLVVHEAALSGCGLILSEAVGSVNELSTCRNSWRFRPRDSEGLARAMAKALELNEPRQEECRAESLSLAKHFGPSRWNESFEEILAISLSSQEQEARAPVISAK